jgi:hypothetical protein
MTVPSSQGIFGVEPRDSMRSHDSGSAALPTLLIWPRMQEIETGKIEVKPIFDLLKAARDG